MELKLKGRIENENESLFKVWKENSKSPINIWKQKFIEIMEIDTWWIKNVIQNPTYSFLRNFIFKSQTTYCVTALHTTISAGE